MTKSFALVNIAAANLAANLHASDIPVYIDRSNKLPPNKKKTGALKAKRKKRKKLK